MLPDVLTFEDTALEVIDRHGHVWLKNDEIASALGYADGDSINRIYSRNADEFTEEMTCTVKLTVQGQARDVRVFSLRGAHLLGMFSRTERAKAFRRWVLDVLDGIEAAPAAADLSRMPELGQASRFVSAGRIFRETLRILEAADRGAPARLDLAGGITAQATGLDVMGLLRNAGWTPPERPARLSGASGDDGTAARVAEWLDAPEQSDRDRFTSTDILLGALGIAPGHRDARSWATRLGAVMLRLGWRKVRSNEPGRQYYYHRPAP